MKFTGKPLEIYEKVSNYLENIKDTKQVIVYISDRETKEMKTRQQEKTYYKIMNAIATHLGYSVEEVKIYILSWCFWTHKIKLSKEEMEVPNISRTRDLTKEQAIFFIDTLLQFVKIKNVPVEITPIEIQSLYNSYN